MRSTRPSLTSTAREQFELLLRGDIGTPAIGRKAILRRMTRCFSARELCRGCKTLPWLEAREAAPAFTGAAPVDLAGLVAGEPLGGPCLGVSRGRRRNGGLQGLVTVAGREGMEIS
jgi:hypothetical protein